jgi:hypothetical protein
MTDLASIPGTYGNPDPSLVSKLPRKTKNGVGTCPVDKDEADKELVGDFLRRAAMRRGFATKLWSKTDREAGLNGPTNGQAEKPAPKTKAAPKAKEPEPTPEPTPEPEAKPGYLPSPEALELFGDIHNKDAHEVDFEDVKSWPEWKWGLAERDQASLEATPWKTLLAGSGLRSVELLEHAKKLAPKVGMAEPDRLDDVHGELILELRRDILAGRIGTF